MNDIKICPSVFACDMLHLRDEIVRAEEAGSDMLHLDVMDGVYVPNISFGFDIIKRIRSVTSLPLDVHMMTAVPWKYTDELAKCGADSVTFHLGLLDEAGTRTALEDIKSHGMKAALSVKPKEGAEALAPYIDLLDMALVMTVEPGFGGQSFMPDMMGKIGEIKKLAADAGKTVPVQVDGGIKESTVKTAYDAGAELFVVGTGAFGAPDMKAAIERIKAACLG